MIFGLIVAGAIATDSGINQGIATNDPSGDVSVGDCETEFGLLTCDITIVNSSDARSDYLIDATVEDPSGAKVGIANTFVTGVEGGQTVKAELTARSQEGERTSQFGSPMFNGPLRSPHLALDLADDFPRR